MEHVETRPLTVVSIVLMTLCWILMALRVFTRVVIKKLFRTDDFLVVASLFTFTIPTILVVNQLNQKLEDLESNIKYFTKVFYAGQLLYVVAGNTAKMSFSVTLLSVAITYQRYVLYTLIVWLSIYGTFFFIWLLVTCSPSRGIAECSYPSYLAIFTYMNGATLIMADVIIVILTVSILKNVMIKTRKKIIIGAFMSLSSMAFGATIVRMVYIPKAITSTSLIQMAITVTLWSMVEIGVFITVTAASVLHPLLSKFWVLTTQRSSQSRRAPSGGDDNGILMRPIKASIRGSSRGHIPTEVLQFSRRGRDDASVSGEYLILDTKN